MKFFSADNPVIRAIGKLAYCWWLDMLWLVTSLPVFTIGVSTTALIYSAGKLRRDEGTPTANFFHSFKQNFKQGVALGLIYLAAGACLAAGLVYWNQADHSQMKPAWAVFFALGILYTISASYVFAIQSRFYNTVGRTIAFSFLLPFRNLRETVAMLVVIAAVAYLNVTTVFAVNFVTAVWGVGLIAFLFSVFYDNAFAKYMPKETQEELSEEEKDRIADEAAQELKQTMAQVYGDEKAGSRTSQ